MTPRQESLLLAAIPPLCLGLAIMLGIHLALAMRADAIHESAMKTLREANAGQREAGR